MNDRAPPMKPTPTPEMIDAFIIAKESADRRLYGFHNLGRHFILDGTTEVWFTASDDYEVGHAAMMAQLERLRMEAALSAALSVPAAAVVGEPVGYVSAPELVQLKMGASCVDLFREPQPGGIDFAPVYGRPQPGKPWRVFEDITHGWWGIEVDGDNDADPILYPIKINRESLEKVVKHFNEALGGKP